MQVFNMNFFIKHKQSSLVGDLSEAKHRYAERNFL